MSEMGGAGMTKTGELRDVVIAVSEVAFDDDQNPYAVTIVHRYDLVGKVEDFIAHLEAFEDIVEGGRMKNTQ